MSSAGFEQFSRDIVRAAQEQPREVIDADQLSRDQLSRLVGSELLGYLRDACSQILYENMIWRSNDPTSRSEQFRRKQAVREVRAELRQGAPR